MAERAIGADDVGAGQDPAGRLGDALAVRARIGALIVEEFVVDGEQCAGRVDGRADVMGLLTGMIGGE